MEISPESRMAPVRFIIYMALVTLGLNLLTISLSCFFLVKSRSYCNEKAEISTRNLAQVLEQNITGTISKADIAVYALAKEVERQIGAGGVDKKQLTGYMALIQSHIPEFEGLRVTNAEGQVIFGLQPAPGVVFDAADRDYFIKLRNNPQDRLVVSKPFRVRIAHKWVIILARPITRPDGSFAGVAFAALSLAKFDQLFSSIDVGGKGVFALRDGSDFGLVSRYPEPEGTGSAVGHNKMSREFLELFNKGITVGNYDAPSGLDSRMRTWGYRKFGNGLYYILVGLAKDEYLAAWRREALETGVFLALFLLVSSIAASAICLVRKRNLAMEESSRANERQMRLFFERQIVGMAITSPDKSWIQMNDRCCQILGYERDELKMRTWEELTHPDDLPENLELFDRLVVGKIDDFAIRKRFIRKDGSLVVADLSVGCARNNDGTLNCILTLLEDVTDRTRAEEELFKSEQRYRGIVENQGQYVDRYLPGGILTFVNDSLARITGLKPEQLLGTSFFPLIHEDDREQAILTLASLSEEHPVAVVENRVLLPDGLHWHQWEHRALLDHDGNIVEYQSVGRDVTEQKLAEQALRESEERFHKIFEESPIGIALLGKQREIILTNRCYREFLGYSEAEIRELGPAGLIHPDDWEPSLALSKQLRDGKIPLFHLEQRYLRKDGKIVWSDTNITALRDKEGQLILTIGWVHDITERKLAEERLRNLSQAVEQSPASIAITDRKGEIEYVNPAFCKMTGYTAEELLGGNPRVLKTGQTSAEEYQFLWETITGGRTWQGEFCNRKKNGALFWESACIAPIFDDKGTINHFVAIKEDITERKRAEEERATLESQLRQAQKMESVGRLAGGVAHDFNNMLTVILGHTALALMDVEPSQPLHVNLTEIRHAAERSTDLTRQLLAFARKQTIAPRVLDLNQSLAGMLKMLQRIIGEDISLTLQASADLWPVKVDTSQIDQILANLCVNARDAMTGTGNIVIQTGIRALNDDDCAPLAEALPGEYVLFSLSDDGCGIDDEVLPHIFEPFFTTKGIGVGTGLGLATVYGIVKQNNGFINVQSELGQGTTFTIYLPRYEDEAVQGGTEGPAEAVGGGDETILLVEDESAVLSLTSKILTNLGYCVLRAGAPSEAINLAKEHAGKIHLLLTDVVMPEMNGRDLANRLLPDYPQLKRLFMSGYTADIIARHGVLDDGVNFIQKPFTMQTLAEKVREVLGGQDVQRF